MAAAEYNFNIKRLPLFYYAFVAIAGDFVLFWTMILVIQKLISNGLSLSEAIAGLLFFQVQLFPRLSPNG